ncbi:MAG TPA: MOSC N-terminal beta barrel domain-containing protein [Alcaligenes sp.]|nr:MOSC N-terminal beta barrel domain-containing protein [Alcaligenes sp.]HRL28449.1 MOSC N-terminal beta barrel domain-containing protein [Alcaligenes sp.]
MKQQATIAAPDLSTRVYPLKGGPGLPPGKGQGCHDLWVLGDADGHVLSGPALSGLAGLELDLRFGDLVLRAPGMMRLDIPVDVIEDDEDSCALWHEEGRSVQLVDEGELAAVWFSRLLGVPVRLLKRLPV